MINKKIMELFERMCKVNNGIIQTEDEIRPQCFIIDKDYKITAISFLFRNNEEKQLMKNMLKRYVLENETKAYILIQDTLMTKINQETNEHETWDVVMRQIFTPKDKYFEAIFHKDKKIIKKDIWKGKEVNQMSSEWNVWETMDYGETDLKQYEKIKKDNPKRYKSLG